jgi:hypothetical protein
VHQCDKIDKIVGFHDYLILSYLIYLITVSESPAD